MRIGSPATYVCRRSGDRGMHKWKRTPEGAECMFCKLKLTGEDAADVFRGAVTPLGQVRLPSFWEEWLAAKEVDEE